MSLLIGIAIYLYVGVGSWLQQITPCSPTCQVREVVGAAKHQLLNRSITPQIDGDIRFILEITQNDILELHKSSTLYVYVCVCVCVYISYALKDEHLEVKWIKIEKSLIDLVMLKP